MTLVELLIVIAIIAIIAGLSMSVLMKARQRAYLATCISNLRQLVQAVHMYEDDWGTVPVEKPEKTLEGIYGRYHQMIYSYINNDAVFLCPADFTNGKLAYSEDYDGRPNPINRNPWAVYWREKWWLSSYVYLVNRTTVEVYGKGSTSLNPNSPLLCCDWHLPQKIDVIAYYNSTIRITPAGLLKNLHPIFD